MGNPMFRNWLWLALLLAILFGGRAEALQTEAELPAGTDPAALQLEAEIAQLQASIAKTQNDLSILQVTLSRYTPEHAKHATVSSEIAELQDELQRLELALETAQQREDAATTLCIYIGPRPALDTDSPGKVYRQQLAELDLLVTVDRDFAEAERRLAVLRLRAMGPPAYDGQREVVVLATERLAEVQLAQRAPDRALETAGSLLTRRPTASLEADEWFTPARPEWIEREREWLQDARLVSLRKLAQNELERRSRTPEIAVTPMSPAAPDVTDEIWRDIQEGDGGLVKAMGSAAVPALEQLAVLTIDGVQASAVADPQRDPLSWLMDVAPMRALSLMAEHVDQRSIVWRKRILRAMNQRARSWLGVSTWEASQSAARPFVENRDWQQILDTLATDLTLWEDTRSLMYWSVRVKQWTPVQKSVVRDVLLDGEAAHFALLTAPGRGPFFNHDTEDEAELLRAALNDARPAVRAYAAERLDDPIDLMAGLPIADLVVRTAFAEASSKLVHNRLRGVRSNADVAPEDLQRWVAAMVAELQGGTRENRLQLARALTHPSLREHVAAEQLTAIVDDPDEQIRLELFGRFELGNADRMPLSEREFHLLRAMLDDPSAAVRALILRVEASSEQPTRLTREELLALAEDDWPDVRGALAWLEVPDTGTRVALYAQLAADPVEDVVRAVESKVQYILRQDRSQLTTLLPYFEARLANPAHPALPKALMPTGTAHEFMQDATGLAMALRFARTHPDAPATGALVRFWSYARHNAQKQVGLLMAQSAEDLAHLFEAAARQLDDPLPSGVGGSPRFEFEGVLRDLMEQDSPELEGAMRIIAADQTAHRVIRVYAFAWLMSKRPETTFDAALGYFREPTWEGVTLQDNNLDNAIRTFARYSARDYRNRFALQVIESPQIPNLIAASVTQDYLPEEPGGVEVSRAMLKRWLTPDEAYYAADDALRHLGGEPDAVDPTSMRLALRSNSLRNAALFALAQLKDPQYLPDLRDCLNPSWIGYHESRHKFAMETAFTISQYMTDEAAEVLLEGVGIAETDEVRQACFDALERIRLYQEARERIGRHSSSAEKRDEAVRELVAMLDDSDVAIVVAAIRGLAALGAVDELPKLIHLMKHADEDVKAAAQAAVARLTEPAPKSDGSDAKSDQ